MNWMVRDTKLTADDCGHTFTGPDITTKAEGFWPLFEQFGYPRFLLKSETGLGSRCFSATESLLSLTFSAGQPLAHCALSYAESISDILLFPALLMQFPGSEATVFSQICCLF